MCGESVQVSATNSWRAQICAAGISAATLGAAYASGPMQGGQAQAPPKGSPATLGFSVTLAPSIPNRTSFLLNTSKISQRGQRSRGSAARREHECLPPLEVQMQVYFLHHATSRSSEGNRSLAQPTRAAHRASPHGCAAAALDTNAAEAALCGTAAHEHCSEWPPGPLRTR